MATKTAAIQDDTEKGDAFGEKRDFWVRYDTLADAKDKAMIGRLNQNLDVLLIFAGLFSAVNTAFIVLTLASLSAPPSYQTNALLMLVVMHANNNTLTPSDLNPSFSPSSASIRQNCTFFASLCSSILAAAGAVLAKQWLQSYERTGQTGTRQKQAMLRTAKWMGSEAWGLRIVVEALPTLLLISLALFFAALCDLLWSTSRPVAIVVVAFTAAGAVFYGFTVIAAAIDTFCPYQTAVSTVIRDITLGSKKVFQKSHSWTGPARLRVLSNLREGMARAIHLMRESSLWRPLAPAVSWVHEKLSNASLRIWPPVTGSALLTWVKRKLRRGPGSAVLQSWWKFWVMWMDLGGTSETVSEINEEGATDATEEILYAQSLLWMLENSTEQDDILACVDNIPTLSGLHSTRIVARSPLFSMLAEKFGAALVTAAKLRTEATEQYALAFARALAHLVIADPRHCKEPVKHVLNEETVNEFMSNTESNRAEDLWGLCTALLSFEGDTGSHYQIAPNYMRFRFNGLAEPSDTSQKFTVLACLALMKLSRSGRYVVLPDLATVRSDAFVSLMCLEVIDYAAGHQQPLDQRIQDVWSARTGKHLVQHLVKAFEAHDRRIATGFNRKRLLELHTRLLMNHRRSRTPSLRDNPSIPSATRCLVLHLSNLLEQCSDAPRDEEVGVPQIVDYVARSSTPAAGEATKSGPGDVGDWEEGLESDPLVQTNLLQPQLKEYTIQLLLYIGALSSNSQNVTYTLDEADTVISGIIRFQERLTNDEDLSYILSTIEQVLGHSVSVQADHLRPVVPLLTRALHSSSTEILEGAYGVLNRIGERSWDSSYLPKSYPALILEADLASALIRNLANHPSQNIATVTSSVDPKGLIQDNARAITRWLAASVREEQSLAASIDEASIEALFIAQFIGGNQGDEAYHTDRDWDTETTWYIVYVFFIWWNATRLIALKSSNDDTEGASKGPAVRDGVIRALHFYSLKSLTSIHRDVTNVELFTVIFTFIRYAFLLRPSAALFFELDVACDALMDTARAWADAPNQQSTRLSDDHEDPEMDGLELCWMDTRREYAGASRTRDATLRYAHGMGWWKFGGLSRACEASRSTMSF